MTFQWAPRRHKSYEFAKKNKAQVNLNVLRWFLACYNTLRGIHPMGLLGWLNLFTFISWNPGMPHAGEPVPAFILFPCKTAGLHHSEVTLKGKSILRHQ